MSYLRLSLPSSPFDIQCVTVVLMVHYVHRLVLRTKELESKLELENATRSRLEVQCNRHKESLEKTQTELIHIRSKETLLQDELKKIKKTLR